MRTVKLYNHAQLERAFRAGMEREADLMGKPGFIEWSRTIIPTILNSDTFQKAKRDTLNGRLNGHKEITVRSVISAMVIASHTIDEVDGISYEEMVAPSNGQKDFERTSLPRMVCMYIGYLYTDLSYPKMGEQFKRDHTSIMHGVKSVASWKNTDKKVSSLLKRTLDVLSGQDFMVAVHEQKFNAYEKLEQ